MRTDEPPHADGYIPAMAPTVPPLSARHRAVSVPLLFALLAGCGEAAVEWAGEPERVPVPPAETRLALQEDGVPAFVAPPRPSALSDPTAGIPNVCPTSLRFAPAGDAAWFAAGWSLRPDRSAALVVTRSADDGATWSAPMPAESLDRGTVGCDRPAPDVAADAASGYTHLAYFLYAPEGLGIFFTHSMELTGELFHSPVAVVYGDRPSAVSITASGDTVLVAYENPNDARPRIGLAISRTMGHIFEERTMVTGKSTAALAPRVARDGRSIAVSWIERGPAGAADAPAQAFVRQGALQ